ncbi:MAG: hypothetical protein ACE5D7_08285, partial [Fidelibacterota bacterium]
KSKAGLLHYITTRSDAASGSTPHFYDKILDKFLPFDSGSADTSSVDSVDAVDIPIYMKRTVDLRPIATDASNGFPNNPDNSWDTSTSTFSQSSTNTVTATHIGGGTYSPDQANESLVLNVQEGSGWIDTIYLYVKADVVITSATDYSGNNTGYLNIQATSFGATSNIIKRKIGSGAGTTSTSGYGAGNAYSRVDLSSNYDTTNALDDLKVKAGWYVDDGDGGGNGDTLTGYVKVYDVYFEITFANDVINNPTGSYKTIGDTKTVYIGANGRFNSYTGGGLIADEIHEVHRDLLAVFAGFDDSDANIDGWSSLDTDRSGYSVRWWVSEPTPLKAILERLQYEGGFIFRFRADGSGQYIHIEDSPSTDHTLTPDDFTNLKVNLTPFSGLITKQEIEYERHPAENRYLSSTTFTNSTARTNWNIQTEEDIAKVRLDALVANVNPGSNPNDSFATYYDNIFGTIKTMGSCTIVNPQFYHIEVGDIVAFSSMDVKAFADNWTGQYMVTSQRRTPGRIDITFREV